MVRSSELVFATALAAALFMSCEVSGLMKVVIDTDVGADDAMAILMILSRQYSSNALVLAITTVRGNTGVENATRGALLIKQVSYHSQIPVYMGSPGGLVYEQNSSNYFGYDGLGDVYQEPPVDRKQPGHAASALADLVKRSPGDISLLCIGPLTNLAIAMHLNPRLLLDLKEVIILGGSYKGRGNIRPQVEFNMYMDPEAAAFVFANVPESKLITLLPLETIEENANFTKSWRLNSLGRLPNSSFMKFLNLAERKALLRDDDFWLSYDPTAASILIDPSVVTSEEAAWVEVETEGRSTRGAMIRDHETNLTNVRIVTGISNSRLKAVLQTYLSD